jgi:hypothetical protein
MDEPTRTLAEMVSGLKSLPRDEVNRISNMGDGFMQLPIAMFERYIYFMTYLRSYLENMHEEKAAGGIECAFLYSFFMQHQVLPSDRTEEEDIMLLRETAFSSDECMPHPDR